MDDKISGNRLFYEIAAKIARFCDEMDKAEKEAENEADKRRLEI